MAEDVDNYHKVKKILLKHLIDDATDLERIQHAVHTIHDVASNALALGKLHYLSELEAAVQLNGGVFDETVASRVARRFPVNSEQIEEWMDAVSSSMEERRGRPYGPDKARRMAELCMFYDLQAAKGLFPTAKLDCRNMSYPKGNAADQLATNCSTNVHCHFDKYVYRFVNSEFRAAKKAELGLSHRQRLPKDIGRQVRSDVRAVVRNLLEAPAVLTCRDELHPWLERHRRSLVPPRTALAAGSSSSSVAGSKTKDEHWRFLDQKQHPERWLPYMVWINRLLEDRGAKLFSPLPQKAEIIPGHIRLETSGLVDLIVPGKERTLQLKLMLEELSMPELDSDNGPVKYRLPGLLGLTRKKGAPPEVTASKTKLSSVLTDIIDPALAQRVSSDPQRHAAAFKTAVWSCLSKLGTNKHASTTYDDGMVFNNVIDTDGVSASLHFVTPSLFGLTCHNGGLKTIKASQRAQSRGEKAKGATYIKDLPDNDRLEILYGEETKVNVDPGKGCIACASNGEGVVISYTSAQRRVESGAKDHARKCEAMLDVPLSASIGGSEESTARALQASIGRVEAAAGTVSRSSRSTITDHYQHYLRTRLLVIDQLRQYYRRKIFRRMRYDAFVGRRASEDRFFSKMKNAFGKDAIILYGDWGRNPNLKHQPPSPGVAFRRRMCSHFRVFLVHEPNTSSVCPRCQTFSLEKPRLDAEGNEIHHLLRCQNRRCPCPWWNRDVLATENQRKTALHALRTGSWHPTFVLGRHKPE